MRQKRAKAYRKLMSLYAMSFGFRQPYQVLVDSDMCKAAIAHKIELVQQLGVVLQGTVKPMITQCCIHELYLQGRSEQPAVDLAKTFERRKCNHKEAIPGDECLTSVIGEANKHRYVLASQSQSLRSSMRNIPAVPIVHVNRSVMILEPPSDATIRTKNSTEQKALMPSASELAHIASTSQVETAAPKKKRKGPKGPNPLSVKKRQNTTSTGPTKPVKRGNSEQSPSRTIGEKRKHNDNPGPDTSGALEGVVHSIGGHKRKRRRKTVAASAPSDHASDD
ncbi:Fcf1-domain-containing protein [Cytidiella melzeri]|nr:Fcf1-domain-containing protein [Cytidiella melzeri]